MKLARWPFLYRARLFDVASIVRSAHQNLHIHFSEPLSHPSTLDQVLRGGVLEPDAGARAPGLSLVGGAYIDSRFFQAGHHLCGGCLLDFSM
jgi:hypothetical protein